MEGLLHDAGKFIHIPHKVAVLHHRQRHSKHIGLLERTASDHFLRHLAGDRDERNRVHEGVCDAGDKVRGTGAGSGHANSNLAGHTSIALGGENPALLVAWKNGADFFCFGESLMDRHRAATGIGENNLHTLALEAFNENFRAIHDIAPVGRSGGFRSSGFFCLHRIGEKRVMKVKRRR